MKATWISLLLLGFVLSVGCSMIRIPRTVVTPPSAETPSSALGTRSASDDKTATVRAYRTSFVETCTRQPSPTHEPTATIRATAGPSPTCRPLPEWLTPGDSFLVRPHGSVTDTLAALMLQTYNRNFAPGHELPAFAVIDDLFGIEIVDGSIDPSWTVTEAVTNTDNTLGVFFSYDPEPSGEDEVEWSVWFVTARKMWIKDFETGEVYWVKWEDGLPHRPIDIRGWPTRDIFVFSQFGNPWHGFLYAIDARQKKVLLTLQLEDWC